MTLVCREVQTTVKKVILLHNTSAAWMIGKNTNTLYVDIFMANVQIMAHNIQQKTIIPSFTQP